MVPRRGRVDAAAWSPRRASAPLGRFRRRKHRLDQLVKWCGGESFDGCLFFDEAHKDWNLVRIMLMLASLGAGLGPLCMVSLIRVVRDGGTLEVIAHLPHVQDGLVFSSHLRKEGCRPRVWREARRGAWLLLALSGPR